MTGTSRSGSSGSHPILRWWWGLIIVGTYGLTAIAYFAAPLGPRWRTTLLGTAPFAPDAVLNAGILEWGYRIGWRPSRIFDWTGAFPLSNSLANTENLIGWQLFYSPLRSLGMSTVAAYNIVLLTSVVLAGVSATCLARHFGANRYGAWIAGFLFAFVPFHLNHAIHLQTMAVCWSPLALLFLDRLLARGTITDAAALAGMFILTVLSGVYFGAFLLLVLGMYALLAWGVGRHHLGWRAIRTLVVAASIAIIVVAPVAVAYLRFGREHGFSHSASTVQEFSVALVDLVKVPEWLAAWSRTWLARDSKGAAAFPGVIAATLASLYVVLRPKDRESSRRDMVLALLGLAALLLSLGPVLRIRHCCPVHVGGFDIPMPGKVFVAVSAVRWPMRILFYSYLPAAVMCGLGVSAITGRLAPRARAASAVLILLLLVVEYKPQSWFARGSLTLPEPLAVSDAYPFLAEEADRGAVVELPSEDTTGYRTPVMTLYTYGSAGHLRRVVAYHGSVRLPAPDRLQQAASELPDPRAVQLLRSAGVTRLVVHRNLMNPQEAARLVAILERAHFRILHNGPEAVVFALDSVPP